MRGNHAGSVYHACLWSGEVNVDTVWSIPCLFMTWWSQCWHSLVNTMTVYGLVKSMLTQFGRYHACLWSGEVNFDIVWLIPCLFMVWWSQCWHSLVNTMPVYGLVKSILTQFGQYHACLQSVEVNIDTVWLIQCQFRAWQSSKHWHSLVDRMPVCGLVKSTDPV